MRVATVGTYAFTSEELNSLARRVIAVERTFWNSDRSAPFLVTAAPIVGSPTTMGFGGTGRGAGTGRGGVGAVFGEAQRPFL